MTDTEDLLPSMKAEVKARAENARKELSEAKAALLREDFTLTFQTPHGQRVLAWIMDRCGYNQSPLAGGQDGRIDPMKTTFLAMELNLYLNIRRHVPVDVLVNIEYGKVKPSGEIDQDEVREKVLKPQRKGRKK